MSFYTSTVSEPDRSDADVGMARPEERVGANRGVAPSEPPLTLPVRSAPDLPGSLERVLLPYEQLRLELDPDRRTLWCAFAHPERPCFTRALLDDIGRFQRRLERELRLPALIGTMPVDVLVWHSTFPDVWNLGGDLDLFVRLIRTGDRDTLKGYARACVDTVYHNWTKWDAPFLTVALIQGDALGGGFEAALTNDVIIAERHSKFGLPEILFNMFPGMGAYSFLSRRLDGARAQAMITSGRLYGADELEAMGLIDLVVEPGEGEAAVRAWLDKNQRRHRVMTALSRVRRRCQPVSYEELTDVVEIWVETALGLSEADLRKMERLARAQLRRRDRRIIAAAA